jgi:cytoskeletal protein RodZ
MNNFNSHTILENSGIIAKELRRARLAKKISLEDASKQLKMNISYLRALETGDFEALPTGVYRHNFLREYANFLGLSSNDLISLFVEDKTRLSSHSESDLFVKKASHVHYFVTIPRLVKNLLIFSASAVCLIYLAICINAIISPPELIVSSPSLDIITDEKEIVVKGTTDPEAELTINNQLVLADNDGEFSKKINLKNGVNTIVIVAHKKYSRKNELVKKVLVSDI